jgi:hypothetical protein
MEGGIVNVLKEQEIENMKESFQRKEILRENRRSQLESQRFGN